MAEPAGSSVRSRLDGWLARFSGEINPGRFRPDWLLLDLAAGLWLAYAFAVFRGHEGAAPLRFALAFTLVAVSVRWLCRGRAPEWRLLARLGGFLLCPVLLAVHAWITGGWTMVAVSWPAAWWLALTFCLAGDLLRLILAKLYDRPDRHSLGEVLRWLALLGAAWWLVQPFYTHRPIGAGDAYWYTQMLADFVQQARAGQFPVWTGVTEYAFNGAVSPLRLAPWFQHAGAALDVLTGRCLEPLALKNALIVLNLPAIAFSAYFFLRAILPRHPLLITGVVLALIASPAVLAPLYVGDQYMTFLALPFLPAAAYGLWRVITRHDFAGHVFLTAAVAGLWLAHPPIALWTGMVAATAYLVQLGLNFRRQSIWLLGFSIALFLLLGTYPLFSALSLDNVNHLEVSGLVAAEELARAFPASFLPLSATLDQPSDYQAGYALLFILAVSLVWLPSRRPPGALIIGGATLLLPGLFLPLPGFTPWFWSHLPSAVLQATNTWPMQRLVPIWSFLIVFTFAAVHATDSAPLRRWYRVLFLLVLTALLFWSGYQADRLIARSRTTIARGPQSHILQAPHNLLLSRYCFVSFAYAPSYFSHGYMDPVLLHRLLRKSDLTPLVDNAESAVRQGPMPAPDPDGTARLAHGTWRAVNDNHTHYYNLSPALTLPPREHLALRLEVLEPGQSGWLQIVGQELFREYMLPDSGAGVTRRTPTRSFGTLPGSSQVIPLFARASPETPHVIAIAPQHTPAYTDHDYARFELWRYDPKQLPIAIQSWIPYRMIINAPAPAWLESPRMWLGGYRARVNGTWTTGYRSPDNLAMFAVPAGHSDVTIRFFPSLSLEIIYWTCLVAWGCTALVGLSAFALLRPEPLTASS